MAREIFARYPEIKKKLWGGEFWTDGYYVATVSAHGNESVVAQYVKKQGCEKEYQEIYKGETDEGKQMTLYDYL